MASYQIVVCGGIVPDPLQTLEPVQTPTGPGLKNEMMLPSVLDPWASHALFEAAHLAKNNPGSKVYLVSLAPKAKLQQLMMSIAQKVPFELVAVDAPAGGFLDATGVADALAKAIETIPGLDKSKLFVFGGCASASRDAGVTLQLICEKLALQEFFMGVDELKVADDGSFEVLERIEGGAYQRSRCQGAPAVIGWATGNLPEPPNNPQIGMANMRLIMPALMKAQRGDVTTGSIQYANVAVPSAKRETRIVKDLTAEQVAEELAQWLKA